MSAEHVVVAIAARRWVQAIAKGVDERVPVRENERIVDRFITGHEGFGASVAAGDLWPYCWPSADATVAG